MHMFTFFQSALFKKYARIVGVSLVALFFVFSASSVQAAALSSGQIQAIVGLLQAFGADQSVIHNVTVALGGAPSASPSSCIDLSYDLYGGETDAVTNGSVSTLQAFLGISPTTGYFGPVTESAVKSWQSSHGIVSSGSPDTTGYGYVGPLTRKAMSCSATQTPPTPPTKPTPPTEPVPPVEPTQGAVSVTLIATPFSIKAGDSTTLSWSTSNAASCTSDSFSVSGVQGSVVVSPTQSTTYSMTCTGVVGANGSAATPASASATVNVASVIPPVVTPPIVTPPQTMPAGGDDGTPSDVRNIIPPFNGALDAVHAPTTFGTGKIWQVGPTRQYKKPSDVVGLVHDGDIVEIDAGRYVCDESVRWLANDLTLVGMGGKAVLDTTSCALSKDKGIWNPQGTNIIIDNIEFMGAHGSSANDAGIRYDGNGYVYITNSYFHDNQNGILFTPNGSAPTNLVIDHSEFAHNGGGTGNTHNMYISSGGGLAVNSFVLRFSYSHDANVGHEVKSRANSTYILYNRLADEATGNASYQLDVPQGGLTYVIGNILQKSPHNDNTNMLAYSMEGSPHPVQKLYVANNTFVNMVPGAGIITGPNTLQDGLVINNLFVGMNANNIVTGAQASRVTQKNNIVTNDPKFFDQTNRIYFPTASSPVVGAGVAPGSAGGFSLVPQYEFVLPHSGVARSSSGALDVGAYAYTGTRVITPAPTLSFTATPATVGYQKSTTLQWTATNATYCSANGPSWPSSQPASGSFTTGALVANTSFSISCTGAGGTVSGKVDVTVNDSAQADALGTYTWQTVPNSTLMSLAPSRTEFPDIFGTGGANKDGTSNGVYVPDNHTWYLLGGSGGRSYYGNEAYSFNVLTGKIARVNNPTHINQTVEYDGSDVYSPQIKVPGCGAALHLKSGGVVMAPFQAFGNVVYDPQLKKIVITPGGFVYGDQNCTDAGGYGQMTTDTWTFDPFVTSTTPVETQQVFAQIAPDDNAKYRSVTDRTVFIDPATNLVYLSGGNRNYSGNGARIVDYSSGKPVDTLVNNVWPFDGGGRATAVDTTHHYALGIAGNGTVAVWNLNGLSMTAYGTNGKSGTNGTPGGPGPLFTAQDGWKLTGDTSIMGVGKVGLTYNPKLDMFVAWPGADKFYFIKLNYQTQTANIFAKHVYGGPTGKGNLTGKFVYIPSMDKYLVASSMDNNFAFLVPPSGKVAVTQGTTQSNTQGNLAVSGDVSAPSTAATQMPKMAPGALSRYLTAGVAGADVSALQSYLLATGYLGVKQVTGYFGSLTSAAVARFQCAVGIVCSGSAESTGYGAVGPKTISALTGQ